MNDEIGIDAALESGTDAPRLLEAAYQRAMRADGGQAFAAEVERRFAATPGDPLIAAWHFRLAGGEAKVAQAKRVPWRLAVPLAVILSLAFVVLASAVLDLPKGPPLLLLAWAPVGACALMVYLAQASGKDRQRLWIVAPLLGLLVFATWFAFGDQLVQQYRILMILHLPLAAWAAVGIYVLGRELKARDCFAFLLKSVEVVLTGGIFVGAGSLFMVITVGIFSAIGITFGEPAMRMWTAAIAGLIPVLALAVVYDPDLPPASQGFGQGLARLISTLGRVFLPLTLLVGLIYMAIIPFNFVRPFEQREVLVVYNAMLFAVMALMVICTPVTEDDLAPRLQTWLRRGLVALAVMTVLVSLYAMSATLYRTSLGGLTPNRLTVIGWNAINIGLLCVYLLKQARAGAAGWLDASHATFRWGALAYAVWTVLLIVLLPLFIAR